MKIIALSGWKQNGKDTSADYIIAKYGATRISFADPLKNMASIEYGISRESFDKSELKEQPLLNMPVDPQDGFSTMLCEFMIKEFRTASGKQCSEFVYENEVGDNGDRFYGFHYLNSGPAGAEPVIEPVYWTPRALAILKGSSNRAVRSDFWVSQAAKLAKEHGDLVVISDLRYKSEVAQLRQHFGNDLITVRVQREDDSPSSDPSERDLDNETFDYWIQNRGTLEELYSKIDDIFKK